MSDLRKHRLSLIDICLLVAIVSAILALAHSASSPNGIEWLSLTTLFILSAIALALRRWLLGAIGIGVLVIVALIPNVTVNPNPIRQTMCAERLEQIGTALLEYKKEHGAFPPQYVLGSDGKPAHSWRVLILPYLGHDDIFRQIDLTRAWDHPVNRDFEGSVDIYTCPADGKKPMSNYVALIDAKGEPGKTPVLASNDKGILISEVNTIPIHWMEPIDASIMEELGSYHQAGFHVLSIDGTVSFLYQPDSKIEPYP